MVSTFLSALAIGDITAADIARLAADGLGESRELEFKRDPYGGGRDATREFLKDVTALANTFGGHLIIGMDEDDGIASQAVPIVDRSFDGEKQRLENVLRDAVEPRLFGVQMQHVPVAGGFVLVIHVPRSWNPPHRVLMGDNRFFGRNSTGAYPMDVEQLRAVFLGASEMEQRVRVFRQERLDLIASGNGPAQIRNQPIILRTGAGPRTSSQPPPQPAKRGLVALHIVPLGASDQSLDIGEAVTHHNDLAPFGSAFTNHWRPNLDGLLTLTVSGHDGIVSAYTQLFRDGRLETVRGHIIMDNGAIDPPDLLEGLERLPAYIRALARFGFGPPFVVMLSLIGVKNTLLGGTRQFADRENLSIDPVTITTVELAGEWHSHLRPLLDALWNAYGVVRCPYFTDAGQWTPPR